MSEQEEIENIITGKPGNQNAEGKTRDGRADMSNFEMDLFDTRIHSHEGKVGEEKTPCGKHGIIKPACFPISVIAIFIFMVIFFPMLNDDYFDLPIQEWEKTGICVHDCRIHIVESIPENLTFSATSPQHMSTYTAWKRLIESARASIDIASFYWSLRGNDVINFTDPTAIEGQNILALIEEAGRKKIKIRIAQNMPDRDKPSKDTAKLAKAGLAYVRSLNFTKIVGGGLLHTKFIIVDGERFYVGSANMDWRSLTQVKELGTMVENCPCLAQDLWKIFEIYWKMGEPKAEIPKKWPFRLRTTFNAQTPLQVKLNGSSYLSYISSSPPAFSPKGREQDINAIIKTINSSENFIHIAVMDYFPTMLYTVEKHFWPVIDNALRAAAYERGVHVKLLMSKWSHTRPDAYAFLNSLTTLDDALKPGRIEVKLFEVPVYNPRQRRIPFARVNHNKYMVTESTAQICTSNWAGDYFTVTAGVSLIIRRPDSGAPFPTTSDYITKVNDVFMRDWNSIYAKPLDSYLKGNGGAKKKLEKELDDL